MLRPILILLVALAVLVNDRTSLASETSYVVIVNPTNPVTELDRNFVRDVFLKKSTDWGGGSTAHPIDLASKFPARGQFLREVIRKTPAQLKLYWNQRIFSGKGVPPPQSDSVTAVIEYVASHPGAIGYIPAASDPGKTKIVRLK
jgi:ABC-type phosphate transport system substrate-binding protein